MASIIVSVFLVVTRDAVKQCLAQPVLGVGATAFAAALTRKRGFDLAVLAAQRRKLVPEHPVEHRPPLVQNGAVEAALLGHVAAGFLDAALGARRHVLYTQFFHLHEAVALGYLGGTLVKKILASVGRMRVQAAYFSLQLTPIGREFRFAGEPHLQPIAEQLSQKRNLKKQA